MIMLRAEIERRVKVIEQASSIILTYDNFEFIEGRREERIDNNREFRFITTALMLKGRRFIDEGLTQKMWKLLFVLLSAEQIAYNLRPREIDDNVSFFVNSYNRIGAS